MICDKCGKNNNMDAEKCSYCGADMPKTSVCGGFGDILSYKPPETDGFAGSYATSESEREKNIERERAMQKLIKKSDNIMKSTQKNSLFGLISVILSAVTLVSVFVMNINTSKEINEIKNSIVQGVEDSSDKKEQEQANPGEGEEKGKGKNNPKNDFDMNSASETITDAANKLVDTVETNTESLYEEAIK